MCLSWVTARLEACIDSTALHGVFLVLRIGGCVGAQQLQQAEIGFLSRGEGEGEKGLALHGGESLVQGEKHAAIVLDHVTPEVVVLAHEELVELFERFCG